MSALSHGLNDALLGPKTRSPSLTNNTSESLIDWMPPEVSRKLPRPEGMMVYGIDEGRALLDQSRIRTLQIIKDLRSSYVFPAGEAADLFLVAHRGLPTTLREAVSQLKDVFGTNTLFKIELSSDEDESPMLYVVALWPDTARSAAEALDRFEENWWLDRMTPDSVDLAFTYRLF